MKRIAVQIGGERGEGHADEEKGSCKKNHQNIDGFSCDDASTFLDPKDDIKHGPQ